MRRQSLWLIVLFILGCYARGTGALAQAPQAPVVEAVAAVGMTVADIERSVEFYSSVISFKKVKDPDGHPLEILQFPTGKGDSKWHHRSDRLFLGIDHTAIVVRDTDASPRFYRDALGLEVVGESENYGIEQEHLNNVFGARLRITTLRARKGPGIEFPEYLTPRDGRPMPTDVRANDLIHWQTTLVTRGIMSLAQRLLTEKFALVAPGIVALPEGRLGFSQGLLVRDPNGHAMQLIER
jgi:catechol 2,3-dioxygenase-like lactoylglutathione lyase family enzyme